MDMKGKVVFITGGAGFIGSALAERLLKTGARVVVYDNFQRNALRYRPALSSSELSIVRGDILDTKALALALKQYRPEFVVHAAAIAGVDAVLQDPVATFKVNLIGSVNLLDILASHSQLKRVILFSTSEIFGEYAFLSDEQAPAVVGQVGEARWSYAISKLAEEHLAMAYYKKYEIPITVIRPFNVYGPGQVGPGAVRAFVLRALKDEPIIIHGDGSQIRAWCYIDDIVEALWLMLTREEAVGEAFNIGNPRTAISIYRLARLVISLLNANSSIEFARKSYADVRLRVPSIQKAKGKLGFKPKVDLEEGILYTAKFYRQLLRNEEKNDSFDETGV